MGNRWTPPGHWSDGERITADRLNAEVSRNFETVSQIRVCLGANLPVSDAPREMDPVGKSFYWDTVTMFYTVTGDWVRWAVTRLSTKLGPLQGHSGNRQGYPSALWLSLPYPPRKDALEFGTASGGYSAHHRNDLDRGAVYPFVGYYVTADDWHLNDEQNTPSQARPYMRQGGVIFGFLDWFEQWGYDTHGIPGTSSADGGFISGEYLKESASQDPIQGGEY